MNKKIFDEIINELLIIKDKENKNLNMDSVIISDADGNYYKHLFNEVDGLHPVRSVCKSIVSMSYSKIMYNSKYLIDGKEITMETKVWSILEPITNLINEKNLERLNKITFFHLFTHTIGFDVKLLKSKDIEGVDPEILIDLVINTPLVYEPGEFFLYSNAAPFLLSVIFQEITGLNLSVFAEKNILNKLGINNYKWRNYGKYCAGATGLELQSDDLHKIALLIANDGCYNGNQIIEKKWIKEMISLKIETPEYYDVKRVFPKYGYGLLMWICGNESESNYFIDGSNGQYIIVIPSKKIVITTLGSQKDMKPITVCFKKLL